MTILDRVVRRIHDEHCRFKIPDDEVKDIEDMVVHLVKVLLPGFLRKYPGCRYSVAEVVDAGSYFEQTKIGNPDEFDFMLVIGQLSSEDSISVTQGCRAGYARVGVVDPELWDKTSPEDGPERLFEIAMLQFNMFVRETLKLILSKPLVGRTGQLNMKDITVRGKPYKAFSHVQTLTLTWTASKPTDREIRHRRRTRSNTNVEMLYEREPPPLEDLKISVDLMSCCQLPLSAFANLLPETSLRNEILKKNGCHIVLKSCESLQCKENQRECRLISYTKTEQECMKKLHVSWKVVYKVLKWLFHYTDILEIDTYKIKTAVLYCSSKHGPGRSVELGDGMIRILNVLRNSAYRNTLPGYFNPSLNIWNVSPCYQYMVKYETIVLLKVFTTIQSSTADYENTELEKYLNIVNLWIHSFCSHSVEISQMKKARSSKLESFNCQGNVLLDIIKDMEPVLKSHQSLSWIPFQMKRYVLVDVFKVLTVVLFERIANMWLSLIFG